MNTSVAFLLIIAGFAVCVFLGTLVVFALRQSKSSRRGGPQVLDGVYPGTWDGGSTEGHATHDGLPHSNPHHHHHHDASQSHTASHHGSTGHDGGASHGGGGHSGGFDGGGGGHSGGFDGGGGFSGGHH